MSVKEKDNMTGDLIAANGDHTLCLTCRNQSSCFYSKPGVPVYYCEEFENNSSPITVAGRTTSLQIMNSDDSLKTEDNSQQFQGLCSDCSNRHNCSFNKCNDGGIWRCEEYC